MSPGSASDRRAVYGTKARNRASETRGRLFHGGTAVKWKLPGTRLKRTTVVAGLLAVLLSVGASAWEPFRVGDIRLLGLQRVSAGTVFNLLPLSVGDVIDSVSVGQLVRRLFASGYFDDVTMSRDGDILIVSVKERPSIESIEIEGNKAIKTESLMEALSGQGLREGEIFKQATLERVGLELERSYISQGRYNASIETKADPTAPQSCRDRNQYRRGQ